MRKLFHRSLNILEAGVYHITIFSLFIRAVIGMLERNMVINIYGSMFSGKSTTVWWLYNALQLFGIKVVVIKPGKDTRSQDEILDHVNNYKPGGNHYSRWKKLPAQNFESIDEIVKPENWTNDLELARVIIIDEAQFFKKRGTIVAAVAELFQRQKSVVIAGIHLDALGRPFGQMPDVRLFSQGQILEIQLFANCAQCGAKRVANFNQNTSWENAVLDDEGNVYDVGGPEKYKPNCYTCWKKVNTEEILEDLIAKRATPKSVELKVVVASS